MNFLKDHPFAVEAFFEHSLVLTFATSKDQLQNLIPNCLTLDTFQDKWAFIAVALVQTKQLRPKGFPKLMGSRFFLIGYRIFVRYENKLGKKLRGLYILKSETNSKRMEILGNLFTHYRYDSIDITRSFNEQIYTIQSDRSHLKIEVDQYNTSVAIPHRSPFNSWKEARRFAGPLPFTFTYKQAESEVLIVQGVRQNWKPQPVQVNSYQIGFLDQLALNPLVLASAFEIKNIPYFWKKGKIEKWTNE